MRYILSRLGALLVIVFSLVAATAAEELVLKDGRKITGTIVGYEDGMFRVETEFGFALVRKDKVASINLLGDGSKDAGQERSERKDKDRKPPVKPPVPSREKVSGAGSVEAASRTEPSHELSPAPADAKTPVAKPLPVKPAALPPPVSRPLDEPLPARIQDHVEGFNYVNDTFQFAMYKPPGWKIYEGVPKETGYGIVAIGTEDERTLLIVDRQVWSGSPDLKNDRAEERLRQTYADYQRLSEAPTQLNGMPATLRVFKGVLDGVEWHGVSVQLVRGNTVFGMIGLTSAETFQFQQSVLNKIINSFHFLTPSSPAAAAPHAAPTP